MHSDPYLASLEQRVALAKLHAASLVIARELLAANRSIPADTREALAATADEALDLLTTKLAPVSTPVLDDAIAKLEHVEGGGPRRANLIEVRDEVRDSLERLHGFVGAERERASGERLMWRVALAAFAGGFVGWVVADLILSAP
jgi:hypothetical protein